MEVITSKIAQKLASFLLLEDREVAVVKYGLLVLLTNLTSFFMVVIFSFLLGIFRFSLFIMLVLITIRPFAGGFHGSTPRNCAIFSVLLVTGWAIITSYIVDYTSFVPYYVFIASLTAYSSIIFYAPQFTINKPRVTNNKRLKVKAAAMVYLFYIIAIILHDSVFYGYAAGISAGMMLQGLVVLPLVRTVMEKVDYFFNEIFDNLIKI